jgi:hypothetical protein
MTIALMLMQAEVAGGNTWDMRSDGYPQLSFYTKLYILFLMAMCFVALVKLAKTWWKALPFLYLRRALRPTYLAELRERKTSLAQWIGVTLIGFGIVWALEIKSAWAGIETTHATGIGVIAYQVRDQMDFAVMVLVVVLAMFLLRWHVIRRIEKLEA